MATTTNYGWDTPDNSGLVKNGAQDIRTLGSAIDTSLWNIGFGQAGKNRIINGDFNIWQRGTTFTNPADGSYTADRFQIGVSGTPTTYTVSRQAFTAGAAPVAGYEGSFFYRSAQTTLGTLTNVDFWQKIEDVRTLAGQTVTLSFWAKADSTRNLGLYVAQNFGSGGSGTTFPLDRTGTPVSVTSSWQRFSFSFTMTSVSGKTIGANSYVQVAFRQAAAAGYVLDIWGVQIEVGSIATPFETASGSIQGELALCQRYYARIGFPYVTNNAPGIAVGRSYSTTGGDAIIPLSVPLRTVATSVDYSGLQFNDQNNTTYSLSAVSLNSNQQPNIGMITMTSTGMTANRMGWLIGSAGANTGYIGFSAEL